MSDDSGEELSLYSSGGVMEELQNSKLKCPKKAFISRLSVDSDTTGSQVDGGGGSGPMSLEQAQARAIMARHQRVESLSQISLPDDLRISFSEIEDSSLHLDDIDLSCTSSVDVDLTSSNITQLGEMKDDDRDLQNINAAISSTSQPHYQRLTSMDRLSGVTGSRSGSVSQLGSEDSDDSARDNFSTVDDSVKSNQAGMPDFMFSAEDDAWKSPPKAQQVNYINTFHS